VTRERPPGPGDEQRQEQEQQRERPALTGGPCYLVGALVAAKAAAGLTYQGVGVEGWPTFR
jgi:hypothetical protein